MLSAGTNVRWLVDDVGLIESPAQSHDLAATVASSEGVVYVPALLGLGTPRWDFGARGTLLGVTRGTSAAHVVRAVLDGIAQRGVDLVEAAEADAGVTIGDLRIDGGMSANPTFVQALADLSQRTVEVSPVTDATTLGAAFLAGLAVGVWGAPDEAASMWRPRRVVEPGRRPLRRAWRLGRRRRAGRRLDPRVVGARVLVANDDLSSRQAGRRPRHAGDDGFRSVPHSTPRLPGDLPGID